MSGHASILIVDLLPLLALLEAGATLVFGFEFSVVAFSVHRDSFGSSRDPLRAVTPFPLKRESLYLGVELPEFLGSHYDSSMRHAMDKALTSFLGPWMRTWSRIDFLNPARKYPMIIPFWRAFCLGEKLFKVTNVLTHATSLFDGG